MLASALGAMALAGCSKVEFADKTARVSISGQTTTYEVGSCGLDGSTAFIVGRSAGGSVLQAVLEVESDGRTGIPASTGLTLIDGDMEQAAFGAGSWQRRGETGKAPGAITSARVRGSRIQAAGRLVAVDGEGRPDPGSPDDGSEFTLDARCDAAET
ncbi:MAG: hypothetical protein JWM47_1392 [Acidimicrobiales bacterium]|nr:hypothetical protein [Acidimicrobiales bacterium]